MKFNGIKIVYDNTPKTDKEMDNEIFMADKPVEEWPTPLRKLLTH